MTNGAGLAEACLLAEEAQEWMDEIFAVVAKGWPEVTEIFCAAHDWWWECYQETGPEWLVDYHRRNDL